MLENYPKSMGLVVYIAVFVVLLVPASLRCYAWPVESFKELRNRHVKRQDTTASCGPASLATILSHFYGRSTTEQEIVELLTPYLEEKLDGEEDGEIAEEGVSMLDLKKVSTDLGIPARGYRIPKGELQSIMGKLHSPLLVRLKRPSEHFALTVTWVAEQAVLADPAWGIRAMSEGELFEKWGGLILALSPDPASRARADKTIQEIEKMMRERIRTLKFSKLLL
ncbi:MAG: C39 family peptidase [Candidatus Bipolaricaulota bacterium]